MADEEFERQRLRFIEKHYPLIEQGADAGGRWEPQRTWRTKHGAAYVLWSHGRAAGALDALLPDGTRGEIWMGDTADRFRRKTTGERLWIHGALEIRPDEVLFVDGEQPVYEPPLLTEDPNLEADLARDTAFRDAIKAEKFARALYSILSTHELIHSKTGQQFGFGNSTSAQIVVNLRALGEIVSDYDPNGYLPGTWPDDRAERAATANKFTTIFDSLSKAFDKWPEPHLRHQENDHVYDLLHAHLKRLGWRTMNSTDQKRLSAEQARRALEVLQDVKKLEQRLAGPIPDWVEPIKRKLNTPKGASQYVIISGLEGLTDDEKFVAHPGALPKRIDELAISGRISKDEYNALLARLPMSQVEMRILFADPVRQ